VWPKKKEEESRSHVSINEEYVSRVKGEDGEILLCKLCKVKVSGLNNMKIHLEDLEWPHKRKEIEKLSESTVVVDDIAVEKDDTLTCKICRMNAGRKSHITYGAKLVRNVCHFYIRSFFVPRFFICCRACHTLKKYSMHYNYLINIM
jgi:hypothetical protein